MPRRHSFSPEASRDAAFRRELASSAAQLDQPWCDLEARGRHATSAAAPTASDSETTGLEPAPSRPAIRPRAREPVGPRTRGPPPQTAPEQNRVPQPAPVRHLNQTTLARRWDLSPRTLERWRWLGKGPPYLKLGGHVAYRLEDVEAFEAAHEMGGVG
jgi:hypothetical protein